MCSHLPDVLYLFIKNQFYLFFDNLKYKYKYIYNVFDLVHPLPLLLDIFSPTCLHSTFVSFKENNPLSLIIPCFFNGLIKNSFWSHLQGVEMFQAVHKIKSKLLTFERICSSWRKCSMLLVYFRAFSHIQTTQPQFIDSCLVSDLPHCQRSRLCCLKPPTSCLVFSSSGHPRQLCGWTAHLYLSGGSD